MATIKIDLYSDTSTQPTAEMRAFMCQAPVGDEQKGEDPSVNELQALVADLLGKEAALFLPSGTMCNQIAYAVHCRAGDLILMDRTAHPLISEAGGAAVLARATMYPIDGELGMFTPAQMAEVMEPATRYKPPFRLVCVEQTTNKPGGRIWPLEQIQAVCKLAHERGALTHLDGARLFNATVATGIDAKDYAAPFDSLWIDLSKGLGAPVGAVLAGTEAFIRDAWQWKQRIGGAMRQAGIVAAAGVYALKYHVKRLADDHAHAKKLAAGIVGAPGIDVDPDAVETNMVRFDVSEMGISAREFADRLLADFGVRVSTPGPSLVRMIPHLNISAGDIDKAAGAICTLAKQIAEQRRDR